MSNENCEGVRYAATGSVANSRISPLVPKDWTDTTKKAVAEAHGGGPPDFLWENAPQLETKEYRDKVKVYSHLPNGTNILDSKWVLGRLLSKEVNDEDPLLATLETHCFKGSDGYKSFCEKVKLFDPTNSSDGQQSNVETRLPDILHKDEDPALVFPSEPSNLWVVKHAMSNGAGGIWVVGPENAEQFVNQKDSPLIADHRFVAQRYVWPPVLFDGRKFHIRVYGLLTSDGRAFVHKRAFLHVANDSFTTSDGAETGSFKDSIHITNCCANSDDDEKFAGEILADFEATDTSTRDGEPVIPLADFFPSVKKCVAALSKRALPFLQGGQANNGFEYLGMDFILSYNQHGQPVAYMLEINAPPSQDTATGLPHAENLHDDVIRDLITLWVVPHVSDQPEAPGGWRCVYNEPQEQGEGDLIAPSKAAIISKIRWALFEKKALKQEQLRAMNSQSVQVDSSENGTQHSPMQQVVRITNFARSQFPYFSEPYFQSKPKQVFFENAGGSQVARSVIEAVSSSLRYRHRDVVGSKTKAAARQTLQRILGAECFSVFIGANASSLLSMLAVKYVDLGLLKQGDEVIVSTENHTANFDPWIRAARAVGAVVKLWTPFAKNDSRYKLTASRDLTELVTVKTRIVAFPHASNVLGQLRDVKNLTRLVKESSQGYAHVIVDGVAAAPHCFAAVDDLEADWYVVSCHKLFGPHIGGLCGRRSGAVEQLAAASGCPSNCKDSIYKILECGTVNYEGCAGVVGLGSYFASLAIFSPNGSADEKWSRIDHPNDWRVTPGEDCAEASKTSTISKSLARSLPDLVSDDDVQMAYQRIRMVECKLEKKLTNGLHRSKKVRIIEGSCSDQVTCITRLPTVCFVHSDLPVKQLYSACEEKGIFCRYSSFLCTEYLATDFGFDHSEGIFRASLAHYNTCQEIDEFLSALESIPGWF